MGKIDELDLERLGKAVISAYNVGKMAKDDKVSTSLKNNVAIDQAGLEAKFVFDLFTKKFEDIEKEWE